MSPNQHYDNTDNSVYKHHLSATQLTGIVLAGGMSTRMGQDKASLPWKGSDLLNTVLARLAPVCTELVVVSNVPRHIVLPNVKIVADKYIRCGPLAGMQAGIRAATCDYSFIAACDMPYLNTQAVAYIGSIAVGYDAAVPFIGDFFNPLHGVYRRTCLPYIERLLKQGRYSILNFYNQIKLRRINVEELKKFDTELKTLININTPEDLQRER